MADEAIAVDLQEILADRFEKNGITAHVARFSDGCWTIHLEHGPADPAVGAWIMALGSISSDAYDGPKDE